MTTAPSPLAWQCRAFAELTPAQLYAVLQRRCEVFVVEQRCAYLDPDGKDTRPDTRHLFACDEAGAVLAYLRLIAPGVSFAEASLGRVLTAGAGRGSGLGHELLRRGLAECARWWPGVPLRIGAQAHLQGYYRRHGFRVASAEYLEDAIPHVEMLRAADPPPAAG